MIKLTSPKGAIYLRKDSIEVIAETKQDGKNATVVNAQVWIRSIEDHFNILEDVDTILRILN